jgi:hypothetical protein
MHVKRHRLSFTTASDVATVHSTERANGRVLQVEYVESSGGVEPPDTTDFVLTGKDTATPILTKANITARARFVPRQPAHTVAAAAALLYAAGGEAVTDYVVLADEQITLVIAGGGDGKTGYVDVWVG